MTRALPASHFLRVCLIASFALISCDARAAPANSLNEMFGELGSCLRNANLRLTPGFQATIRFALKRNGSVLGQPRVTFIKFTGDQQQQIADATSLAKAFDQCTPVNITDGLGGAVAGRIIIYSFGLSPNSQGA